MVARFNNEASIRFIQPLLLQSFEDKFKCKAGKLIVPAEAGGVLVLKVTKIKH